MQGDSALGRALAVVRDLRKRSPWNAAQTPYTLRPYLVEEVLELDHAIASGDPLQLRDELVHVRGGDGRRLGDEDHVGLEQLGILEIGRAHV